MASQETPSALETFQQIVAANEGATGTELAGRIRAEVETVQGERGDIRSEFAGVLRQTADDLDEGVGTMKTKKLPDGVAGQAYQGMPGSGVIDISTAVRHGSPQAVKVEGDSLIDAAWAKDVKTHEIEHEAQATVWTAESVEIGNEIFTRLDISEAGAMSVQVSIAGVSAEYKGIYRKVAETVGIEKAKEVGRSGDLAALAAEP